MTHVPVTAASTPTDRDEFARFAGLDSKPHDELVNLARDVGLRDPDEMTSDDLRRRVGKRVDILRSLDPEALADILRWGRRTVPPARGRMLLAREILTINRGDYDTLSHRGLVAIARLRGMDVTDTEHAETIVNRLRESEGFWPKFHRKRRKLIGRVLDRLVEAPTDPPESADEPDGAKETAAEAERRLRRQIENHGVVGGIASRLRGVADSYIESKLDEIELRIDAKLDEIDRRLAEWRDREIANRLRILRITLLFTLLVALLSLGYNYGKSRFVERQPTSAKTVE